MGKRSSAALIGVAVVIVLWYGGRQVIHSQISVGDFVVFTVYLGMLAWPMPYG